MGRNSREETGLDWKGGWHVGMEQDGGIGEWREKESKGERERGEESEGCSSVSALWSRASWDSRTLCQDSALQNQSLSTEHIEKDAHSHTHVHALTCKQIYIHMIQAASLSGFIMAALACHSNVR